MILTKTGYRIDRNGVVITSIEKEAVVFDSFMGESLKQDGVYYYFNRKQGTQYVYLP